VTVLRAVVSFPFGHAGTTGVIVETATALLIAAFLGAACLRSRRWGEDENENENVRSPRDD